MSLEGPAHGVTTILRINRHASKQAANVIIGLPSISARFHQKRLAYLGKLLEMGPRRWPRRVYDLDPTFMVKLNGPRMRQWRTASLKLVKDARLEEHLGKPTWAAEVRRWAKEFDREAVLYAESNQHQVEAVDAQQRRLPDGRSSTGVPLPRGTGGRCCFLPLPVSCSPPEKRWRLATRGEAVVWDSQSPLHGSHRRRGQRLPPLRPDGKRRAFSHRALRPCHEDVRGRGRGEVLLRLRSRPHPALLGVVPRPRAGEKLLLTLGGPALREPKLATRRSWRAYGPPATRP